MQQVVLVSYSSSVQSSIPSSIHYAKSNMFSPCPYGFPLGAGFLPPPENMLEGVVPFDGMVIHPGCTPALPSTQCLRDLHWIHHGTE